MSMFDINGLGDNAGPSHDQGGNGDTPSSLYYPPTLQNGGLNPGMMQFSFFTNTNGATDTSPSGTIYLAMPEHASNPSTMNWDTENMGFVGNTGIQALKAIKNGTASSANIEGAARGAVDLVKNNVVANSLSALVQGLGGSASAAGITGAVSGKVANPYMTAIFRGIDFRNFTFTFKFTPITESDCDMIQMILNTFRAHSLPNYTQDQVYLDYPSYCEIAYLWNGQQNKYMPKFKQAACTGLDIDYTGAGTWTTMRNGFPSLIIMTTKWTEISIVTRNDVTGDGSLAHSGGY